MSRFKTGLDLAYAQHESEQRIARVMAMGPIKYGDCTHDAIVCYGGEWSPAQHCKPCDKLSG